MAEKARSGGGIDSVDGCAGGVDYTIGGGVDSGGIVLAEGDEEGLVDVVVNGDGGSGEGKAEAFAEVGAADAGEVRKAELQRGEEQREEGDREGGEPVDPGPEEGGGMDAVCTGPCEEQGSGERACDVDKSGEARGPRKAACSLESASGELDEFAEEAVGEGDPRDERAELGAQGKMRVEHSGAEEQEKSDSGNEERMAPGAREGGAVAAEVADEDHLHAKGGELAERGDEGGNADEGAVFAAAESAADEDEVEKLRGHGDALAGDHPERALAQRFLAHIF